MVYKYKPRSADQVTRRQAASNNDFVSIFKDGIKQYKVKEDAKNALRIMPPTWDDPEHYGVDVWVHYGVGPDNVSVLCLQKHLGKRCPVCELRTKLQAAGDEEEAKALRPGKAVAMYVVDRDNESEGVMAWRAPFSLDQDILALCVDESGELLNIDDPKEGYDIYFSTAGKGIQRKYKTVRTAKKPSTVSTKLMSFVEETPLPDALNFLSAKEIEGLLGGTAKKRRDDDDDDDDDDRKPTKRRASRQEDDDDDRPMKKPRGRAADDDDDDDEPAPKKKSRARDDDDDEEDERPKTKRRSARDDDDEDDDDAPPKKKAKRVVDEDDDEDDEPAPKKKRKPADDDDEDEDPPFDKGKKVKRKDDDDEDEDDEDDDEDEKPKSQVRQRLAQRKRR